MNVKTNKPKHPVLPTTEPTLPEQASPSALPTQLTLPAAELAPLVLLKFLSRFSIKALLLGNRHLLGLRIIKKAPQRVSIPSLQVCSRFLGFKDL